MPYYKNADYRNPSFKVEKCIAAEVSDTTMFDRITKAGNQKINILSPNF